MSNAARELLVSFEALPDADKHAVVVEILRRIPAEGDVPLSALDGWADELFAALDVEETTSADR